MLHSLTSLSASLWNSRTTSFALQWLFIVLSLSSPGRISFLLFSISYQFLLSLADSTRNFGSPTDTSCSQPMLYAKPFQTISSFSEKLWSSFDLAKAICSKAFDPAQVSFITAICISSSTATTISVLWLNPVL